jgi:NAD(P)-dependent dehydrogenase (short-subunit alcohol dehydrogenase family)
MRTGWAASAARNAAFIAILRMLPPAIFSRASLSISSPSVGVRGGKMCCQISARCATSGKGKFTTKRMRRRKPGSRAFSVPFDSLYSISKAAAFSLSQSLRALLAKRGVSVHIVLPGPIDTDMTRNLEIPKASPESAARAILDGMERGDEEIFPDPMSGTIAEGWRSSAVKALERQFAAYVQDTPVKS